MRSKTHPRSYFMMISARRNLIVPSGMPALPGKTVVNDEQQAYIDSPETIYLSMKIADDWSGSSSGGILALHPRYRKNFPTPWRWSVFDFIAGRSRYRNRFLVPIRHGFRQDASPGWERFLACFLGYGDWKMARSWRNWHYGKYWQFRLDQWRDPWTGLFRRASFDQSILSHFSWRHYPLAYLLCWMVSKFLFYFAWMGIYIIGLQKTPLSSLGSGFLMIQNI